MLIFYGMARMMKLELTKQEAEALADYLEMMLDDPEAWIDMEGLKTILEKIVDKLRTELK